MEILIALFLILATLCYVLYRKKMEEGPRQPEIRRVYQRGGGSAISASSMLTESCTSCSTLKPVPSTQPSPVKTGTDYDGSATSDTVGPASDSTTTGHSTASTPTAAGSEVETQRFICDCGNTGLSPEERDSLPPPEEANYRLTNPIQVFPIKFGAYKPMELVEAIEGPSELNPAALRPNPRPKTTRLTAFQPSLHSVYLAHHYATLIQELIENYNYL